MHRSRHGAEFITADMEAMILNPDMLLEAA
jgi:hypothetical protein